VGSGADKAQGFHGAKRTSAEAHRCDQCRGRTAASNWCPGVKNV